ncbi:MAG: glutamate synthase, partial [Desulfobulbus sp.]
NGQLTLKELPYIIQWDAGKCTRCGQCTTVCPQKAIEPSVMVQRVVTSEGPMPLPQSVRQVGQGIMVGQIL